jgi:hypothetical protein
LRKWLRRYTEDGLEGLASRSRRPRHSPNQKVFEQEEAWILALRRERKLGARRIQHELRRLYNCFRSLETIHKVLTRHPTPPIRRPKRPLVPKRYSMRLPGERAQMDTMKLAPGLYQYQYTRVDDCHTSTRYLVAALYPRRTAVHTLEFLDSVLEQTPFPIQRLQTDNGTEFLAYKVRDRLLALRIKHRPIPPRTHHGCPISMARWSGRRRRSSTNSMPRRPWRARRWPMTWRIGCKTTTTSGYMAVSGSRVTPINRWAALEEELPSWDDVIAAFDLTKEMNYVELLTLRRQYAAARKK